MRDALHWPDLALLTGSAETPAWLAIEVELTRKGAQRLRAILAGVPPVLRTGLSFRG
jgi:hypothetical protein